MCHPTAGNFRIVLNSGKPDIEKCGKCENDENCIMNVSNESLSDCETPKYKKEMARWENFLELEEYREKQKEIEEFQRFCREYPEDTAFLNVPDDRLDELPDDEQERLISRLMRVYRRYFD
ncbi:unnamed protein product [Caenorhabditis nigoni]